MIGMDFSREQRNLARLRLGAGVTGQPWHRGKDNNKLALILPKGCLPPAVQTAINYRKAFERRLSSLRMCIYNQLILMILAAKTSRLLATKDGLCVIENYHG